MPIYEVVEINDGGVFGAVTISYIREGQVWVCTREGQALRSDRGETDWHFSATLELVDGRWVVETDTATLVMTTDVPGKRRPPGQAFMDKVSGVVRKAVADAADPGKMLEAAYLAACENADACLSVMEALRRHLAVAEVAWQSAAAKRNDLAVRLSEKGTE